MGQKLRKTVSTNGVVSLTQDYLGGIELKNNRLESIYNEEGRAYNTSNATQTYPYTWRYEYNLKDHLGNTRLVFTDKNNNGKIDDQTEVLQETHYYPFGMTFNGSWYTDNTASKYKYQYNGKELNEDFGLNMSDYGARWYDAAVGRWWGIDPLAEAYYHCNQYAYVLNNPAIFIDPNGMASESPEVVAERKEAARSAIDNANTQDRMNAFYSKGNPDNGYERHRDKNGKVSYTQISKEGGEDYDVVYDGDHSTLDLRYQNPYVIPNPISPLELPIRIGMGQWKASRPAYAGLEPIDWTDYVPSKALFAGGFKFGMALLIRNSGDAAEGWMAKSLYSSLKNNKALRYEFESAMKKGFVRAQNESGIKMLTGSGIKGFKYEIKLTTGQNGGYRALGNLENWTNPKTGEVLQKIIFRDYIKK